MRQGSLALHPATVLPAYLDTLARGRRVAVLGDGSLGLGERFLERGARTVHVFDRDAGRAAECSAKQPRGRVQFSAFADDLAVRQGAFDIVIVPDLSLMSTLAETVRIAKRLVPPSGLAVFAAPNPDAERWLLPPSPAVGESPGYYELYDLVAAEFSEVRMLGQAPFVGYTLVDFAAPDPEVAIDTSSLDEAEVPEWYVAVASERPLDLTSYSVVEVALADVSRASASTSTPASGSIASGPITPRAAVPDPLTIELQQRVAHLETENERLIVEARLTIAASAEREREHEVVAMRAGELERDMAEWRNRAAELERVATDARARADRTAHQVKDLDEELGRQRDRATRLTRELDDATKARVRAEESMVSRQLSSETMVIDTRLAVELATMHERVRELEAALAEAGDPPTLRSLQNAQSARIIELEKREQDLLGREGALVDALDALRTRAEGAELRRDELTVRARSAEEELAFANAEMNRLTIEVDRLANEVERLGNEVRDADERRAAAEQTSSRASDAFEETHAADLEALEKHLVDQGHESRRLTRELREAERIGRELLSELMVLREGGGDRHAEATHAAAAQSSEASHTAAAERARLQADLSASAWRIAQLERELASRPEVPPAADARTIALEEALVTAQREIGELRFALRGAEITDAASVPSDGAAS